MPRGANSRNPTPDNANVSILRKLSRAPHIRERVRAWRIEPERFGWVIHWQRHRRQTEGVFNFLKCECSIFVRVNVEVETTKVFDSSRKRR